MFTPGALEVSLAKFGKFQTGVNIQAPVYLPKMNYNGCDDDFQDDALHAYVQDFSMNGFVLLEDGGCSYETKARNVERMGAQALLIAADSLEYIPARDEHLSNSKYDGNGHMIDIPTLIIKEEDGMKLMELFEEEEFTNDNQLILSAMIDWTDNHSETVSFTMYYGSIFDLDPHEMQMFWMHHKPLMDKAYFIPRILTFECL